jgi:hypothetical protein
MQMTATKLVTARQVREAVHCDTASKNGEVYTVRRSFFYTHGRTAADLEKAVFAAYPQAVVIEAGEVWKPFRGGASVAQQSHWFVKFTLPSQ